MLLRRAMAPVLRRTPVSGTRSPARRALRPSAPAVARAVSAAPGGTAAPPADLPRGSARAPLALSPGETLVGGAFEVLSVEIVEAYNVTAVELLHTRTGARWLHVDADDENNVFNVAFRTSPADSTGVAHILEHTALCGSERYPIRQPFFAMLKRSLSTFMNAMTAPDYTMYPFATMNAVDYYNLLGVYLDAAFFPLLTREDFLQEGHRYEFADPNDPSSGLQLKGVVFNEMKGAMGSQAARFGRAVSAALFPTSTFHHNSGGDPVDIPSLTHEQLRAFHATSYHPSNARFYTYGDLPLERTLSEVDRLVLSRFDRIDVSSLDVLDEERYPEPKKVEVTVPADAVVADPARQTTVSVAWLLVNQVAERDSLDAFALSVASDLMLSGPQASFYESLIEPNLGSGFAPGTGYGSGRRETSFAVGLKGVKAEDAARVEALVLETLERVAEEGFPRDRVDAVVHQIELGAARVSPNFGLGVGMGVMGTWLHGGDALRPLRVKENAARLVEALDADPGFWQSLIRRRFLDNTHRVTVVASADAGYDAKLEAEEKDRVSQREAALTAEESAAIVADAAALKAAQDKELDVEVLPTLRVAEAVPREAATYPSAQDALPGGVPLQVDAQPTNGITYVEAYLDASGLPDRLTPYLPLFCDFMEELGTKGMGYKELAEAVKASTGGVGASLEAAPAVGDPSRCECAVRLSGHALDRNVPAMMGLMGELVSGVRWASERARLTTLLTRRAAAVGASLSSQGLSYARARAAGALRPAARLEERAGGLDHVYLLQRLAKEAEGERAAEEVGAALAEIAGFVLARGQVTRCRVVAQEESVPAAKDQLAAWLAAMPEAAPAPAAGEATLGASLASFAPAADTKTFVAVPTQTNYCAASVATVPYTHEDAAALFLLGQAMSTCYLHTEIREKGGAYGGGCSADPLSGTFSFQSYRDPRTLQTLEAFEASCTWAAAAGSLSARDVEEASLRAFKGLDAPRAPEARGAALFRSGLTDEHRAAFRERLLACDAASLAEAAERYLVPGATRVAAVVGNAAAVPVTAADGWDVLSADGTPVA